MSNIRKVAFRPEVNQTLVDVLENMLARAKSGEFVSGGFYGICNDGTLITAMSSTTDRNADLLGLTRLVHRIQIGMDADCEVL